MNISWESRRLQALVIVAVTLVVYWPAMRADFIWDDAHYVIENPFLRTFDGLYRLWFTTDPPDYYPLTFTVWWLEWRLWGANPTGYHVVNVLLHGVNSVLIWLILDRLKVPGAWWAGLVFAVHPVNVASVAWISEQKNTLSLLFYALSIAAYLKFDAESWRQWYWLSLAMFLLALLCKTSVVMLPLVLLACQWWLHGRIGRREWIRSLPFFGLSMAMGLVTIWFQYNRALGGESVRDDSFFARLAGAGWAIWFYLFKAIAPFKLSMIYPSWNIDPSSVFSYLPGLLLVGLFAVFWHYRQGGGRCLVFGLGYFVITLFPVLGFFDQGFYMHSLVADHWQYVSIIGVIGLIVGAATKWYRHIGAGILQQCAAGLAVALVFALGALSWQQTRIYLNNDTLWADTLKKNPGSWAAHTNVGFTYSNQGHYDRAMEHFAEAIRINPRYHEAYNNLGAALAKQGKIAEAISNYREAIRLKPTSAGAYYNLGVALAGQGQTNEAIACYARAVQIRPERADAQYNLGVALEAEGKTEEAIVHYRAAARFKADDADVHYNLARALDAQGRVQEAIPHYAEAVRLRPDSADAHNNLGIALARVGQLADSAAHLSEAVRLQPGDAGAHNNLAGVLMMQGRTQEAIDQYRAVLRLRPDWPEVLDALAAAYAEAGRFDAAIQAAQQALAAASAGGQPELAQAIQDRLESYQQGQPSHGNETTGNQTP